MKKLVNVLISSAIIIVVTIATCLLMLGLDSHFGRPVVADQHKVKLTTWPSLNPTTITYERYEDALNGAQEKIFIYRLFGKPNSIMMSRRLGSYKIDYVVADHTLRIDSANIYSENDETIFWLKDDILATASLTFNRLKKQLRTDELIETKQPRLNDLKLALDQYSY